jgi:hypothetical protein
MQNDRLLTWSAHFPVLYLAPCRRTTSGGDHAARVWRPRRRRRSDEAGIDLHLVKPADPGQLLGLLNRFRRIMAD